MLEAVAENPQNLHLVSCHSGPRDFDKRFLSTVRLFWPESLLEQDRELLPIQMYGNTARKPPKQFVFDIKGER